jgi:hypothetical protein
VVVDSYFYPFMSAQMYEGSCTKTEDCRKGLECRPNPKDVTKKICLGAATETCPTCEPGTVIDETSCGDLIKAAVENKQCPKCEPGTTPVTKESCLNFINTAKQEATSNCPAPANPITCATLINDARTAATSSCPPAATPDTCSQFCNCPSPDRIREQILQDLEAQQRLPSQAAIDAIPTGFGRIKIGLGNQPPQLTLPNPSTFKSITLLQDGNNCNADQFLKAKQPLPDGRLVWENRPSNLNPTKPRRRLILGRDASDRDALYCTDMTNTDVSLVDDIIDPYDSSLIAYQI